MVSSDADLAAPVTGRRERKKAATHAALREAALRLVARHGVEKVTIEQLAGEADIAVRTFFNYYATKEEALVAPLTAEAEAFLTEFRSRPAGESVLQALREAALSVLDTGVQVDALRLIARAPSLLPQRLAVFAAQEEELAAAIAARVEAAGPGVAAPGPLYPMLCAATMLTAMRIVLDGLLDRPAGAVSSPATIRDRIDQVIAQLTAGLDWPAPKRKDKP